MRRTYLFLSLVLLTLLGLPVEMEQKIPISENV